MAPSLLTSILNVKYVNSPALNRVAQEFESNGINISKQTMSNRIVKCADKYFAPFVERMRKGLLKLPITQSDETPTQMIQESECPSNRCYMWVHRSGELYPDRSIVIYEYQKDRAHHIPLEFYKNYKGILLMDGLSQYHLVEKSCRIW